MAFEMGRRVGALGCSDGDCGKDLSEFSSFPKDISKEAEVSAQTAEKWRVISRGGGEKWSLKKKVEDKWTCNRANKLEEESSFLWCGTALPECTYRRMLAVTNDSAFIPSIALLLSVRASSSSSVCNSSDREGGSLDAKEREERMDSLEGKSFLSSCEPSISVCKYLERLAHFFRCSKVCFLVAVVYIDRLIGGNSFKLCPLNVHRLIVTALMVAVKFEDDVFFSNAFYARVGGVPLREMNFLEVSLLSMLDYRLRVQPEEVERYLIALSASPLFPQTFTLPPPSPRQAPPHRRREPLLKPPSPPTETPSLSPQGAPFSADLRDGFVWKKFIQQQLEERLREREAEALRRDRRLLVHQKLIEQSKAAKRGTANIPNNNNSNNNNNNNNNPSSNCATSCSVGKLCAKGFRLLRRNGEFRGGEHQQQHRHRQNRQNNEAQVAT